MEVQYGKSPMAGITTSTIEIKMHINNVSNINPPLEIA
jgi:hypothetical protein